MRESRKLPAWIVLCLWLMSIYVCLVRGTYWDIKGIIKLLRLFALFKDMKGAPLLTVMFEMVRLFDTISLLIAKIVLVAVITTYQAAIG